MILSSLTLLLTAPALAQSYVYNTRSQIDAALSAGDAKIQGDAVGDMSELDYWVLDHMLGLEVPNASLAVVAGDGRLVLARGYTNYASTLRLMDPVYVAKPDTRYRIASVSKPITAAATFRLIEQGCLDPDQAVGDPADPLISFALPPLSVASYDVRMEGVTVAQLLGHRSGYLDDPMRSDDVISCELNGPFGPFYPVSDADRIAWRSQQGLDADSDTIIEYNNYNYMLLGEAIAAAAGVDYEDYVTEQILLPVGMNRTAPGGSEEVDALPDEVAYYSQLGNDNGCLPPATSFTKAMSFVQSGGSCSPGGGVIGAPCTRQPYARRNVEAQLAHGGWVSTALDLARFGHDFVGPSPLLSASSIATMQTMSEQYDPSLPSMSNPGNLGHGFKLSRFNAPNGFGHTGTLTDGTDALLYCLPNTTDPAAADACLAIVLNHHAGYNERDGLFQNLIDNLEGRTGPRDWGTADLAPEYFNPVTPAPAFDCP